MRKTRRTLIQNCLLLHGFVQCRITIEKYLNLAEDISNQFTRNQQSKRVKSENNKKDRKIVTIVDGLDKEEMYLVHCI